MRSPRLLLAAAVTTSLVLTGCGSEQDDPVDTARDYVLAVLDGDVDTVCELSLTDEGNAPTADEDLDTCKEGLEPYLDPQGLSEEEQEQYEADRQESRDSLERDSFEETTDDDAADDEATVGFTIDDNDEQIDLKKVDDQWYVVSS